jgi:8-oxo-dGTP pyrophosphatase MutT (NUDIX family)
MKMLSRLIGRFTSKQKADSPPGVIHVNHVNHQTGTFTAQRLEQLYEEQELAQRCRAEMARRREYYHKQYRQDWYMVETELMFTFRKRELELRVMIDVLSAEVREAACVIIQNSKGQILTVTRKSGSFGFPGGKRDPEDQSTLHAGLRELFEETGITLDPTDLDFVHRGADGEYMVTTFISKVKLDTLDGCQTEPGVSLQFRSAQELVSDAAEFKLYNIKALKKLRH